MSWQPPRRLCAPRRQQRLGSTCDNTRTRISQLGDWAVAWDGYAASHRAVYEMKADGQLPANTTLRSSKYLNNLIEQAIVASNCASV